MKLGWSEEVKKTTDLFVARMHFELVGSCMYTLKPYVFKCSAIYILLKQKNIKKIQVTHIRKKCNKYM